QDSQVSGEEVFCEEVRGPGLRTEIDGEEVHGRPFVFAQEERHSLFVTQDLRETCGAQINALFPLTCEAARFDGL
ncbi:MAG TPA: hypothetical protein VEG32_12655, partial [Clostridia bacterium]|nr:hypothetical protein [Clostridia bacterium]